MSSTNKPLKNKAERKRLKKTGGLQKFNDYFSEIYGERWTTLSQALTGPSFKVGRKTKWFDGESVKESVYEMDIASVFPAVALNVNPNDKCLDLCAAPGGKSLILAEGIEAGEAGGADGPRLICNELSEGRRRRLHRVLVEHLPEEVFKKVKISGHDGAKWGLYEKNAYDKVLLDVPCSGERHLLENRNEMDLWSPSRGVNLSKRQYALLVAGVMSAKPGARLVYSTCSINPVENDDVIARYLKKKKNVRTISWSSLKDEPREVEDILGSRTKGEGSSDHFSFHIEATEFGQIILPDKNLGAGPIYFSVLEKN